MLTVINNIFLNAFLKRLQRVEKGSLMLTLPSGEIHTFAAPPGSGGVHATLHLHSAATIRMLATEGDIGLAEAYKKGYWSTEDIEALFTFGIHNKKVLGSSQGSFRGQNWLRGLQRLQYAFQRNSKKGSKRNISAHYDLGNDFYQLWLDASMTYSSALFAEHALSLNQPQNLEALEAAQAAKYQRILGELAPAFEAAKQAGEAPRLLEVGCGWGGFANACMEEKPATHYKGITLSTQQQAYAQKKLKPFIENDTSSANVALEDYRIQDGTYTGIVSIEMFEAVGEAYWPTYFAALKKHLHPGKDSRAVIQTITIDNALFPHYCKSADMIRTYIFPGGMLPSLEVFVQHANAAGLAVQGTPFAMGKSYAETLRIWLKNFDAHKSTILNMGFDEGFIRLWRFYLAGCAAAFEAGKTNVYQITLKHA